MAFWAAVVVAQNLTTVAALLLQLRGVPVAPMGLQFWLLSAVIHAADVQSRNLARRRSNAAPPASRSAVPQAECAGPWPPGQAAT